MTYRGKVQGGVVVLQEGITLPEGVEVTVTVNGASTGELQPSIWQAMEQLAQWAETQPCDLPEDLAANHDYYLPGLPKRK